MLKQYIYEDIPFEQYGVTEEDVEPQTEKK